MLGCLRDVLQPCAAIIISHWSSELWSIFTDLFSCRHKPCGQLVKYRAGQGSTRRSCLNDQTLKWNLYFFYFLFGHKKIENKDTERGVKTGCRSSEIWVFGSHRTFIILYCKSFSERSSGPSLRLNPTLRFWAQVMNRAGTFLFGAINNSRATSSKPPQNLCFVSFFFHARSVVQFFGSCRRVHSRSLLRLIIYWWTFSVLTFGSRPPGGSR